MEEDELPSRVEYDCEGWRRRVWMIEGLGMGGTRVGVNLYGKLGPFAGSKEQTRPLFCGGANERESVRELSSLK